MGGYLIAASWLNSIVVTLEVIFGLGMLIFIHELGHFVVAKACGVKCEKFYLGFDIGGWKLWSFRRGETEYGIGVLPLGGYVKMLGQDDNPARAAEEYERSKLAPDGAAGGASAAEADELHDPRSYLAQSVPERMAIISAGVIMNLVLAVFMAAWAYSLGVKEAACGISATIPGEAAWKADLWTGDRITAINGYTGNGKLIFEDLLNSIVVGRPEDGVQLRIERDGSAEPLEVTVHPEKVDGGSRGRPTIGVTNLQSNELIDVLPANPQSVAAEALQLKVDRQDPDANPTLRVVAINGQETKTFRAVHEALARHRDEPITLTIQQTEKDSSGAPSGAATIRDVVVPPASFRTVGLAMEMGPITAIQAHSPAERAGLAVGDVIKAIDGQPAGDPQRLPDQLRKRAGETLRLTIERQVGGQPTTAQIEIAPREVDWFEQPGQMLNSPWSLPALGVTYRILPFVAAIEPGGPAATARWTRDSADAAKGDESTSAASLEPGVQIVAAEIIPAPVQKSSDGESAADPNEIDDSKYNVNKFEFASDKHSWPAFFVRMQQMSPKSKVRLTLADKRQAEMTPVPAADWHNPERGFNFGPELIELRASTIGEAFRLALAKTKAASLLVYKFLRALSIGQVSSSNLGGPGTIFVLAQANAQQGLPKLLMFLTAISANLAVINMLPIPVLDGGHMVFLLYEGLRGKRPNEKIQGLLTWFGLAIVLFLLLYTNGLDIARFVTWWSR